MTNAARRSAKGILDAYRAHTVTRLDALAELAITTWDEVELLLEAFREGDRVDDAHLRYQALAALESATVDRARLVRALVALVPGAKDQEDLLERVTDLAAHAPDDVVEPLVAHARARFAAGVRAVWDDRYAFEALWAVGRRDELVVPFACEVVRALCVAPEIAGDGSLFSCAVDALAYLGARPASAPASTPVVLGALECPCCDIVRAAAAALHRLVGSTAMVDLLVPIFDALIARRDTPRDLDAVYPDLVMQPLLAARADWFDILWKVLDSDAAELVSFTDPGRLLRSPHATPAQLERLRALTTSPRACTAATAAALVALVAEQAGGDALAARIVRYERLPAPLSRNVYDPASVAVVHDGALWVPQQHVVRRAPDDEWMNDEERLGVRRVGVEDGEADRTYLIPPLLPMTRNGAASDKRLLRIEAVDDERVLAVVTEPFADDTGWGARDFRVLLDLRREEWTLLTAHGARVLDAGSALARTDAWSGTATTDDDARDAGDAVRLGGADDPVLLAPSLRGLALALRVEARRVDLEEPALTVIGAGLVDELVVLLVSAADPDTEEPVADLVVTLRQERKRRMSPKTR